MPPVDSTLLDIARAARLAVEFAHGMSKEAFLTDLKTQSAVLHQLVILGEAVKRLPTEFRAQHRGVTWSLIAGMRDHLIHGYDEVDLDEVWKTVSSDVPALLERIQSLLPAKS